MEAMIVSPAPSSPGNQSTTNSSSAKGAETDFAPALNEAINENSNSSSQSDDQAQHQAAHSKSRKEANDGTSPAEGNTSEQADHAVAGAASFVEQNSGSTHSPSTTDPSLASRVAANTDGSGGHPLARTGLASADEILALLLQGEKSKLNGAEQPLSFKSIQKDSSTHSHHGSTPPGNGISVDKQIKASQLGKDATALQWQAKDSITISQSSAHSPSHAEHKSSPASLLEAMAHRANGVDKSGVHNQGQHANTNGSIPLSAEIIAARLSDMPFQQSLRSESLRDGRQSLRHDWMGEFIEAKVDQLPGAKNGKTGQQLFNSDGELSANNSTVAMAKVGDKSADTSFSQVLQPSMDKPLSQGADLQRPGSMNIMLSQFQENNLLHQVIHKIRLSQHLQDSKVVMKLHPAELGNLKINIQLKEGVISANVLAQSQQVQEILERNMPRLRALMEEQGLKVNEITINLDNDPTENSNLFEEHLAQDNTSFANHPDKSSNVEFVLEAVETDEEHVAVAPPASGVNVLI